MQIFAGGLIGFFPFFFTFPLGGLFGGSGIDQSLPDRIWQTIDRYAGNTGAATGKTQRLTTIPCPECGVANPQNAERCSACGASLIPPAGCSNCGHVNPPGARFCNRCGAALLAAA
jgi:ribosomal protein L40E